MPDSPQADKWYVRYRWALLAAGGLLTQFHHIEPNVKRMAELAGIYSPAPSKKAEPPTSKVVVEAAPKLPPPKPAVAPVRTSAEMIKMLVALGGDKWEPHFNAHFKNRETAMVEELTEVVDGQFKFAAEKRPTYYVAPRNRADLKKYKPGSWLLIEGDLDRFTDTVPELPDEIAIVRARVTEVKEPEGITTGSNKR